MSLLRAGSIPSAPPTTLSTASPHSARHDSSAPTVAAGPSAVRSLLAPPPVVSASSRSLAPAPLPAATLSATPHSQHTGSAPPPAATLPRADRPHTTPPPL